MEKVSGSFRMCPKVKKNVEELAKKENRSFNNMLEELARRQWEQHLDDQKAK